MMMELILTNGYPLIFPETQDDLNNYDAREYFIKIPGVIHFEWKYELTVEFADHRALKKAQEITGWPVYQANILTAPYDDKDGYEAPAIIVKDKAYCGFILHEMTNEENT